LVQYVDYSVSSTSENGSLGDVDCIDRSFMELDCFLNRSTSEYVHFSSDRPSKVLSIVAHTATNSLVSLSEASLLSFELSIDSPNFEVFGSDCRELSFAFESQIKDCSGVSLFTTETGSCFDVVDSDIVVVIDRSSCKDLSAGRERERLNSFLQFSFQLVDFLHAQTIPNINAGLRANFSSCDCLTIR